MSELGKIQPAQRILPPVQDQHVNQKKKNNEQNRKKKKPESEEAKDHKVDEYI